MDNYNTLQTSDDFALDQELEKLKKKLTTDTKEAIDSMDRGQLDKKLLEVSKYKQALVTARNKDPKLNAAKEKVKELSTPHNEAIKGNETLARYIALMMEKKGFL